MKELMSNGFANSIAQAIEEMKVEQGNSFSLEHVNLAELERRTGVSRGKLRRLKRNGFQDLPRKTKGSKHKVTKLSGYTGLIDSLLKQGIKNSSVILDRLQQAGYTKYPHEHWLKIRSNNGIERINREIRRRTNAVGAFPDGNSALMLVCARLRFVSASEWGVKTYLNMDRLYDLERDRNAEKEASAS